ncbi:MAG: hypothetical protein QM736_10795 [Vicinamibacterales bacterium]
MGRVVASCVIWLLVATSSPSAQRTWTTGTWEPRDGRTFVIDGPRDIVTADPPQSGSAEPEATAGNAVQFSVDGRTVYVKGTGTTEYALVLRAVTPKYSGNYTAVGSGHYIKSVGPGGTTIVLEDGSRWDMDPRQHFAIVEWQPEDSHFGPPLGRRP